MKSRILPSVCLVLACYASCATPAIQAQQPTQSATYAAAEAAFKERNFSDARGLYLEALQGPELSPDIEVQCLARIARIASIEGDEEAGLPFLERSLELASPDEPLGWSRAQIVRGVYARESGEQEQAVEIFHTCYDYCMQRGLFERGVDAAHHAALAADTEGRIDWGLRGIAAAEASGVEEWLGPLWNNLGWTYDELERNQEALDALRKAHEFHSKSGDPRAILIADWSVGHALRTTGQLAEARGTLTDVLARAQERRALEPTADSLEWCGHAHWELGELLAAEGDADAAVLELEAAAQDLLAAGIDTWWPKGLAKLRARIDELR